MAFSTSPAYFTRPLAVLAVAWSGACAFAADDVQVCQVEMEQAHLDNRESGPDWILIDDKIVVPADPRRAEDVRRWFTELQTRSTAASNIGRYRIVEFDLERLLHKLRGTTPFDTRDSAFSATPDLVIAPFMDRIYGLTVSKLNESIVNSQRVLIAQGVLTNSYGVRGEWQLNIDLSAGIVGIHIDSTQGLLQTFHPPDSSLVVLGEIDRCRLNEIRKNDYSINTQGTAAPQAAGSSEENLRR